MKNSLKLVEPGSSPVGYSGPYQEIAVQVRDLLNCDYALVATAENDSIRVQAIAGGDPEASGNLAVFLVSKLRDWGTVFVDDSRLVVVPVGNGDNATGLLVGYSLKPGRFTAEDLERLESFSPVAAIMLASAAAQTRSTTRDPFNLDELGHFSRLITIGELSACFAHEVANPLMLIRGHLRFIEESLAADHPLRINFDVIDRAARRIEQMTGRWLDFSRKRGPRTEPCDISTVISDALNLVQPYFRTQRIDAQVHLEPELPLVKIDRWQMVQAIVNLAKNAADAMAGLDKRVLSITARVEKNQMRLAITDIGGGINPSDLPQIFDPFFTTKGERGTGLGLYITKQVIDEHGGNIEVQTGARGTTFVISLPL